MKKLSYILLVLLLSISLNVNAIVSNNQLLALNDTNYEYVKVISGDLNHDGILDENDNSITSKVLVNEVTLTDTEFKVADVIQDGSFTSADQIRILQMVKGNIPQSYIYISLLTAGSSDYLLDNSELNGQGLYKKITLTNPTLNEKILMDNKGKENIQNKSYVKVYAGDVNADGKITS